MSLTTAKLLSLLDGSIELSSENPEKVDSFDFYSQYQEVLSKVKQSKTLISDGKQNQTSHDYKVPFL